MEVAFGTVGMTVLTTVLAVAMFAKGYRRAAAFVVGVMIATAVTTTLLKLWFDRDRPLWQAVEHLLETNSFPSGHASSIAAFAGIVMVLVAMLVRRANLRRLVVRRHGRRRTPGVSPTGSSWAATTSPT